MSKFYRQLCLPASRVVAPLMAAGLALALGACATAIPLPAMVSQDDVTNSIPVTSPLSSALNIEDWRRARGALGLALDPQGAGTPVAWDNPASRMRGLVTPVGDAYVAEEKICRVSATLIARTSSEIMRGRVRTVIRFVTSRRSCRRVIE